MADDSELRIDYQSIGKTGKTRLTARFPDGSTYTDKVDVFDADDRRRFAGRLCEGRDGLDWQTVIDELERIGGDLVACPDEENDREKQSQADKLVSLAQSAELFHCPGEEGKGYATITTADHRGTWPIRSNGFRQWLSHEYFNSTGKVPGSQALQDSINVLDGNALYGGLEIPVAVRLAQMDGAIYLDLADKKWRAVKISPDGWEVTDNPPVRFLRRGGMLPLPEPVRGGSLDELRPLVNLPDDDGWRLFVAWMVAAFCPDRPFPILAVNGEQGSAKSTLCRIARNMIDPNMAPLRRPRRDDRDLMIAATNGWVVAFDNLSGIRPDLADSLCVLATGGGLGTRQLYSDNEEILFDATRPILINGIEDVATRSDLLDRSIVLTLPTIADHKRTEESVLWERFNQVRPRILGALLDAVSQALRNLPHVRLDSKPRMADFATWIVAAEPVLPWPAGSFLRAYTANRGAANSTALEAAVITLPLMALLDECGQWEGTATNLLADLEERTDEKTRKRKDWPTSPRKLSSDLRRIASNLRREGYVVDLDGRKPGGNRRRLIRLEKGGQTSSLSSQPSRNGKYAGPDAGRLEDDEPPEPSPDRPDRPGETPGFSGVRDGRDGRDGILHDFSNPDENEVMEWTA